MIIDADQIKEIKKIIELKDQAIRQAIKCFKLYEMEDWETPPTLEHRNFMCNMDKALQTNIYKLIKKVEEK